MIGIEERAHEPLLRYSFKKGRHAGEIYMAGYKVCANPICTCCRLDLIFETRNNQSLSPPMEITIDVAKRSAAHDAQDPGDRQFGEAFVVDLDEQDWHVLTQLFCDQKTVYTENSDLMSLDITFPIHEIETSSKLVSYHGILPFARLIHFPVDDAALLVEDLYCVQPFCDCHDAHLFFTPYDKNRVLLPFRSESPDETYVIYNTSKNRWSVEEQTGIAIDPKRLMAAFQDAHDIQRIYRDRYRTIRKLYENFRHRNSTAMILNPNAKIGRNDPCPCGSGKKYKHCCMIKTI